MSEYKKYLKVRRKIKDNKKLTQAEIRTYGNYWHNRHAKEVRQRENRIRRGLPSWQI